MPEIEIQKEVESLDAVPEALRGFYEARESGGFALADLNGLKKNRDAALKEAKKRGSVLDSLRKKGVDPDKVLALEDETLDIDELLALRAKERERALRGDDADAAKIPDEVRRKWEEQKQRELGKLAKERERLEAELLKVQGDLKTTRLTDRVRAAALKAGIIPDDIDDVLTLTLKHFDLDTDGKIVVRDEDGDPMDTTLDRFWTEYYKERKPKFYAASGAAGGGSQGGATATNGSKTMTRSAFEALDAAARAARMKEGVSLTDA